MSDTTSEDIFQEINDIIMNHDGNLDRRVDAIDLTWDIFQYLTKQSDKIRAAQKLQKILKEIDPDGELAKTVGGLLAPVLIDGTTEGEGEGEGDDDDDDEDGLNNKKKVEDEIKKKVKAKLLLQFTKIVVGSILLGLMAKTAGNLYEMGGKIFPAVPIDIQSRTTTQVLEQRFETSAADDMVCMVKKVEGFNDVEEGGTLREVKSVTKVVELPIETSDNAKRLTGTVGSVHSITGRDVELSIHDSAPDGVKETTRTTGTAHNMAGPEVELTIHDSAPDGVKGTAGTGIALHVTGPEVELLIEQRPPESGNDDQSDIDNVLAIANFEEDPANSGDDGYQCSDSTDAKLPIGTPEKCLVEFGKFGDDDDQYIDSSNLDPVETVEPKLLTPGDDNHSESEASEQLVEIENQDQVLELPLESFDEMIEEVESVNNIVGPGDDSYLDGEDGDLSAVDNVKPAQLLEIEDWDLEEVEIVNDDDNIGQKHAKPLEQKEHELESGNGGSISDFETAKADQLVEAGEGTGIVILESVNPLDQYLIDSAADDGIVHLKQVKPAQQPDSGDDDDTIGQQHVLSFEHQLKYGDDNVAESNVGDEDDKWKVVDEMVWKMTCIIWRMIWVTICIIWRMICFTYRMMDILWESSYKPIFEYPSHIAEKALEGLGVDPCEHLAGRVVPNIYGCTPDIEDEE